MLRIISTLLISLTLLTSCSVYKAATGTYKFYKIDNNKVQYYSWNPMSEKYNIRTLQEADSATFKQINVHYGKDKKYVFYGSTVIDKADTQTFTLLNEFYAIDKNNAYVAGRYISNADAKTFEYIGNNWSKDKNSYFWNGLKVNVCDFTSFKIAPDKYLSRGYDNYCYFYENKKVPIKDINSLKLLRGNYAKDKHAVYWGSILIENADSSSFEVKAIGHYPIARDKNLCFSGPRILTCNGLNKEGKEFCRCNK
ncbi:DKNYY domain-containing protein [Colwellia sp. MEBiC06753]